jgi:hypothetical protein
MNFGTEREPKCGICKCKEYFAYYKNDILMENVICSDCSLKYEFVKIVSDNIRGYQLINNRIKN